MIELYICVEYSNHIYENQYDIDIEKIEKDMNITKDTDDGMSL